MKRINSKKRGKNMVLELSNDFLKVQFKEKGGELSSIKDKDGVE